MGLCSCPQGDGTSIITVDWPYYTSKHSRKYYQHHDYEGAHAAAVVFADRRRKDGSTDVVVKHNPEEQNITCAYRVRDRVVCHG